MNRSVKTKTKKPEAKGCIDWDKWMRDHNIHLKPAVSPEVLKRDYGMGCKRRKTGC